MAWPENVFVTKDGPLYGGYIEGELSALACFAEEENAEEFAEWCREEGFSQNFKPHRIAFDDARRIAKARKLSEYPVTCMVLLDDPDNPEVHYVQ